MNVFFFFICLNIFIHLDDHYTCNCQDDDEPPVRLDDASDEAGFQR